MKTALVIIIVISAFFAVKSSIRFWNQTKQEFIWKRIGFMTLAFILGAIVWPYSTVKWLKKKPILKRIVMGTIIMAIVMVMIWLGCALS